MLKKIRIIAATLIFCATLLLFFDFTGVLQSWLSWIAGIQFIPAILALNLVVVAILIVLTLLFGRIYCSILCPLGIFQDLSSWLGGKCKKNRFSYKKPLRLLRYGVLGVFVLLVCLGFTSLACFIEPYSAFGRMASELFSPIYNLGNNALAYFAERADSYAFYSVDVYLKSGVTLVVAILTFLGIGFLAWRNGRIWCNSICPVGTILGFLSKFSVFRPVLRKDKCMHCGMCAKNCKSCCIDLKTDTIDYSRCVTCMNCVSVCKKGAIAYACRFGSQCKNDQNSNISKDQDISKDSDNKQQDVVLNLDQNNDGNSENLNIKNDIQNISDENQAENHSNEEVSTNTENDIDRNENTIEPHESDSQDALSEKLESRRSFIIGEPAAALLLLAQASHGATDGGLAALIPKERPQRETPLVPAGSQSLRNVERKCVGCQLCIRSCPNNVLFPSTDLRTLMQPRMTFERGYCRPECTRCSEICPTGAISEISRELKSSTQVGHAVIIPERCIAYTKGEHCRNCMRHCPTGAIKMTVKDPKAERSPKIPVVSPERCIGCGACEHLCPVRPLSGIVVEGHAIHTLI